MEIVDNIKKQPFKNSVNKYLDQRSHITTEDYTKNQWLGHISFSLNSIKIFNSKVALNCISWIHISIGNVISIFKGVIHRVGSKHMHGFQAGFCCRFSRRCIEKNMFKHFINTCFIPQKIIFTGLRTELTNLTF